MKHGVYLSHPDGRRFGIRPRGQGDVHEWVCSPVSSSAGEEAKEMGLRRVGQESRCK